ncbi:glutamate receptor 2.7-like [Impatiens glandulifera]|uniref:glutamate receptor 2.7-like n=1 Tax=Impatiens glandulifera TaxID=253017 RepID=UPI001FB0BAC4|nr:glutamate receptor 2.7-like [Impatiens glandulifera]
MSFKLIPKFLLLSIILLSFNEFATADDSNVTRIGVIIDAHSPNGRQQEIAIKIAAQSFNQSSDFHKLFIHFKNSTADPLQAARAAEELIQTDHAEVIIGMDSWQEATLVAEIGNRAQIPVLSFAAAATEAHLAQLQWPFLVQMGSDFSGQMKCIGEIIRSYNWKKLIVVYQEDTGGTGRTMLARLSDALQGSGSEIEHRLVFPPLVSIEDPNGFVLKKMTELIGKQSRVFVVLQASLSLVIHLFEAANELGFIGKDSVWIISGSVSSTLRSSNTSIITLAKGVIGIEDYYPDDSAPFREFKSKFQPQFHLQYPNEEDSIPGIHALRAFDSVNVIANALKTKTKLLENILSSNFTGLTGNITFENRELVHPSVFKIINFIGKTTDELGFWSPDFGFKGIEGVMNNGNNMKEVLVDVVKWPGKPKGVPKGWAMPTNQRRLKIGVPANTSFEKFVKIILKEDKQEYTGFCIEFFEEAIQIIEKNYSLPYEFLPFIGTYDALIDNLINKTFDAIVGDITILANRSKYVEFTQPFAESGLSMMVPVKGEGNRGWLFVKPFNKKMWLVTALVMIYTTLIVWFLERQSNPEFGGPWKNQISTALWFTFCTLFFSQSKGLLFDTKMFTILVKLPQYH